MERAEGKIRISSKHRYRLIIFQMRLGIWNNISHAGPLRRNVHFLHPRLSLSLCLPVSLAARFYILLHQLLIAENQRQICTTAFSFMFVPFVPLPSPPTVSPKDGKNFNDSWEDSGDLIGNCDCHSKDLGLFGRKKGRKRRGKECDWGIEGARKKNPGFVQTKKWIVFRI